MIYVVGGAVRDILLGNDPKDIDYVVTGTTPDDMIKNGFNPINATNFPIFLDNEGNEYALARTERKNGKGYHGFDVYYEPDVTIEDDLCRRDITINAMCVLETDWDNFINTKDTSLIIDPYNGQEDLKNNVLRHVSHAFADDPVRVLRVGRFASKLGFKVANETIMLMREMVDNGELNHLTSERVWNELERSLRTDNPTKFFNVLLSCRALKVIFPELDKLRGVPQTAKYHPEVDTYVHVMMVMNQVCKLSDSPVVRFAALVHDLGKGITPADKLPSHPGHEEFGVPLVELMCDRLHVPNEFRKLAIAVCRFHLHVHKAFEMRAGSLYKMFNGIGAIRQPEILKSFLDAVEADARGRKGFEDRDYKQRTYVEEAFVAMQEVVAQTYIDQGFSGKVLGDKLMQGRILAIKHILKSKYSNES